MINWALPIEAVGRNNKIVPAQVDKSFAQFPDKVAVRLLQNAWTGGSPSGTWYFNNNGYAVAGLTPEGYNGYFTLRNVQC